MRRLLQVIAFASGLALIWIAFAHRIRLPGTSLSTDSMIAPRRGEYDAAARIEELDGDGVAGEVIFPQMAVFGAGLLQYRHPISEDQNLAGNKAYNRWLADFCKTNPGRHAGVAIINIDNIEVTVQEVRDAHAAGLFGGVLLPTSTGDYPFYHHYERYAPLWAVCEELNMPIHTHSGWSGAGGLVRKVTLRRSRE